MTQHPQITVDLIELREATASVRADTDLGLRPGLTDAEGWIQYGVRFGQFSPSGEADAARQALLAALTRHEENGRRHVTTAEQLSSTLQQIVANYTDVDMITKLDVHAVESMLSEAMPVKSSPGRKSIS